MINSRDLNELLPEVKTRVEKFIQSCKDKSIDILVTSTYRDMESQAALYAQGRTQKEKLSQMLDLVILITIGVVLWMLFR